MERIIHIDGKDVPFKATGSTLRLYRFKFGRDLLVDFAKMYGEVQEIVKRASGDQTAAVKSLSPDALTTFENVAYIMARQADPTIPSDPDEWLDGFTMFSIYEVLPEIVELWNMSQMSTAEQKKKLE